MSTPFRLLLPAQFVKEMFAQARAELPNECCGMLAGLLEPGGLARATQRYPLGNAAASPVLFESSPRDMFTAERDRRRRGIEFLAIYHSHPTSDPIPSKTDRERNYSTELVNLIISLKGETPTMRGWWLTAESATEADWQVV